MRTFDELVTQLRAAEGAGFDVSETQAAEVLNRWIKRLAALSRWVKEEVELGPTVADQELYPVPEDIIEIHDLFVGGETTQRVSARELFQLKNGSANLVGGPPWIAFTPRYSTTGAKQFAIYPAPTAAGAAITGFASIIPADMSGTEVPPFPDDAEETLLHGAQSTLARDLDNDPDMADYHEGKLLADAEVLRRRANTRVGSGAFAIPFGRY